MLMIDDVMIDNDDDDGDTQFILTEFFEILTVKVGLNIYSRRRMQFVMLKSIVICIVVQQLNFLKNG